MNVYTYSKITQKEKKFLVLISINPSFYANDIDRIEK